MARDNEDDNETVVGDDRGCGGRTGRCRAGRVFGFQVWYRHHFNHAVFNVPNSLGNDR